MSFSEVPTQESQNADAETGDSGSIDAAALAFEKREQGQKSEAGSKDVEEGQDAQDTDNEPEPEDETESNSEEEAEEADPQEDEPTDDLVEVEIEGKTYKVPPEVQKGYLRQSDYSRKMNEVGAKEKTLEQRLQAAEQLYTGAEKFAEVKSEVMAIDAQLEQFKGINWGDLRQQNPGEAALKAVEMLTLQQHREAALARGQGIGRELQHVRDSLFAEKRSEMVATLEKSLPGWGNELGTKITQYAISQGYTHEQIAEVTDPNWVIAMNKAMKFDALQASKPALKAKAKEAPPVAKPGAARPPANKGDEAMSRLRKSGSLADAEAAFAARSKR